MATSIHADVRWQQRRAAAAFVDVLALASPFALAIVGVIVAAKFLPRPTGPGEEALWWIAIATISAAVLFVSQRQARRLLPLASLLRLCMAFPDQAPSRLNVAMRAGTVRDLERRLARVRDQGLDEEPAKAAETILTLASALNAHDRRTRGHSERVRAYTDLLAEQMGLDQDDRDRLRWSALLHDIGKLEVGRGILNKAGPLDDNEWTVMHQHPEIGARVTQPLHDWLGEWVHAVDQHHESFDGTGYPHHLVGDEITIGARIVAVADAFEVMTAMRSYKQPMDAVAARRELANCAGIQFDPTVVRAFFDISLGRLMWVMGPLAWLASLRFVRIVQPTPALRGLRNVVAVTATLGVAGLLSAPSAGFKADADSLPAGSIPFLAGRSGSPVGATSVGLMRPASAVSWVLSGQAASPAAPSASASGTAPGAAADPGTTPPAAAAPTTTAKTQVDKPKPKPASKGDVADKPKPPAKPTKPAKSSESNQSSADRGSQGNSVFAHDHSHDAECGNHGHWVSTHGAGC